MRLSNRVVVMVTFAVAAAQAALTMAAPAPPKAPRPYHQKQNIVYGEVDGVALLMDVFEPKGKKNGVGIIDVVSGYWHSDRGKIEDHRRAGFYDIFCGRGYTVFAIWPGSVTKFSAAEMVKNLRT